MRPSPDYFPSVILSINRAGPTFAATRIVTASTRPESGVSVTGSRPSAYSGFASGSFDRRPGRRDQGPRVPLALPEQFLRPEEPPRQAPGRDPVVARKIGVARAHRQSVLFPDDRRPDDLDAEVEVPRHRADHRQLLVILLSEDRHMGLRREEQLRHHRGDPAEVSGARRAAQPLRNTGHLDERLAPLRVHVLHAGEVHRIDSRRIEHRQVPRLVPRVLLEILAGAELRRVDEDRRRYRAAAVRLGDPNQAHVPLVQVPHRGDQPDPHPFGPTCRSTPASPPECEAAPSEGVLLPGNDPSRTAAA